MQHSLNTVSFPYFDEDKFIIHVTRDLRLVPLTNKSAKEVVEILSSNSEKKDQIDFKFANIEFLHRQESTKDFIAKFPIELTELKTVYQLDDVSLPLYFSVQDQDKTIGFIGFKEYSSFYQRCTLEIAIQSSDSNFYTKIIEALIYIYHRNFDITRFECRILDEQFDQKICLSLIGFKKDGSLRDSIKIAGQFKTLHVYSYIMPTDYMANLNEGSAISETIDPYQQNIVDEHITLYQTDDKEKEST